MNEFLFFITIIVSFFGVILAFRLWDRRGLFVWVGFATIIANIEVSKCVDIFGMSMTLGNVVYGSTFLCTDIISELYGGKESRKAVKMGFFALVTFVVLSQFSLLFRPNEYDQVSGAMHTLLSSTPRTCLASLTAYFISNTMDTYLYDWIGKHTRRIWIKNNASTFTSQLVDSILFTELAFAGTFPQNVVLELIVTTYAAKGIVAICDTPFVYWATSIHSKSSTNQS
mgnify:CR=1 FL=1